MDPVQPAVTVEPAGTAEATIPDATEIVDDPAHPLPPVVAPRRSRAAQHAKRVGVGVAGTSVLGAGVAMLVLPGPGLVVIVAGLAILATEFAWAERRLDQAKEKASAAADAARNAGRRRRREREP